VIQGLDVKPVSLPLFYSDVVEIPPWAASAVAETDTAGFFRDSRDSRGGAFAPAVDVTVGEMAVLLTRLLEQFDTMYQD
jgi:hypothetical protein